MTIGKTKQVQLGTIPLQIPQGDNKYYGYNICSAKTIDRLAKSNVDFLSVFIGMVCHVRVGLC